MLTCIKIKISISMYILILCAYIYRERLYVYSIQITYCELLFYVNCSYLVALSDIFYDIYFFLGVGVN